MILVTGGARSGKSQYAESLYAHKNDVVYIATAQVDDDEMRARVRRHQHSRPDPWITFEGTYYLHRAVSEQRKHYLLDCLSLLCATIMRDLTEGYETIPEALQTEVERTVLREVELLNRNIREIQGELVIVTNEVGWSIVPEHHVARVYRDILGRVNQQIASWCDAVYLVVCGIPMKLK